MMARKYRVSMCCMYEKVTVLCQIVVTFMLEYFNCQTNKLPKVSFRLDIVFHLLLLLSSSMSFSYIDLFFFESTLSNFTNCVDTDIFLREPSSKFINLVMKFKIFHLSQLCDLIDGDSRLLC